MYFDMNYKTAYYYDRAQDKSMWTLPDDTNFRIVDMTAVQK